MRRRMETLGCLEAHCSPKSRSLGHTLQVIRSLATSARALTREQLVARFYLRMDFYAHDHIPARPPWVIVQGSGRMHKAERARQPHERGRI